MAQRRLACWVVFLFSLPLFSAFHLFAIGTSGAPAPKMSPLRPEITEFPREPTGRAVLLHSFVGSPVFEGRVEPWAMSGTAIGPRGAVHDGYVGKTSAKPAYAATRVLLAPQARF